MFWFVELTRAYPTFIAYSFINSSKVKLPRDKGFYIAKVQKIRGQILVSLIGRFVKL